MIITVPNSILTTPAKSVGKIDGKIKQIISRMKFDLINKNNPKGVGLAATQIGVSLQLFLIKPTDDCPIEVFMNPEIIWKSKDMGEIQRPKSSKSSLRSDRKLEGCLSIPNVWGYLKRHKKIILKFMDETGKKKEKEFSGFEATIIQHETDHINGILFTQRVLEQKQKLYTIENDKKGKEELVEIEL